MANYNEINEARKLLGLGEVATLKEIKASYKRLATRYHPDKHAVSAMKETEDMMKRLNQAYKLLEDYCQAYRYSFRKEDVSRTYPDEEYLENWREKWFDSI